MSKLFAALYLDEDVDILVADLVRARGFSVMTTRDAGKLGADDQAQLAYAIQEERVFFTHNRVDFEGLAADYFTNQRRHYGIIIATRHPPHEVTRRLLIILNHSTADEMENQIVYI
jgi:predicted nuclease of predicted toxin-antitoxin system